MKAILVIDIPDNYQEFGSGDWYIAGEYLSVGYKDKYGWFSGWKWVKNNIIALKPMPERKPILYGNEDELKENRGFNKCIDEILGVEE